MYIIGPVLWAAIAAFTAYIAGQKGRGFFLWLFLGLAFSFVALVIITFLPPKKSKPAVEGNQL